MRRGSSCVKEIKIWYFFLVNNIIIINAIIHAEV